MYTTCIYNYKIYITIYTYISWFPSGFSYDKYINIDIYTCIYNYEVL